MSKFQVGDTVRVVDESGNRSSCRFGDICTVISLPKPENPNCIFVLNTNTNKEFGMYDYRFELVHAGESRKRNELEELVRKANEGIRAVDRIVQEFPGMVLYPVMDQTLGSNKIGKGTRNRCEFDRGTVLEIIKLPAFVPFDIRAGRVELDESGTTLRIGCQSFIAYEVLQACNALLGGEPD
jgi:hypothetical protein